MEVEYVEKYTKLSDMKAGDIAVSKNREDFFVCGNHYDAEQKKNVKVILQLNKLYDQYSDKRSSNQPILILKPGDKFVCSR